MPKVTRWFSWKIFFLSLFLPIFSPLSWAATLNVPQGYATVQAAIDAAQSGDTVHVTAGTYNGDIVLNKSGITLEGENRASILNGTGNNPVILCQNLSQPTVIRGFKVTGGTAGIRCLGTVSQLTIDNNLIDQNKDNQNGHGVLLEVGASAVISNNTLQSSARGVQGLGSNSVQILKNQITNCRGSFGGGIVLGGGTAQIIGNSLAACWDGAINLNGLIDAFVASNRIQNNGGWGNAGGVNIGNSIVRFRNNLVFNNGSDHGDSAGLDAFLSTLELINNIFYSNNISSAGRDGDALSLSGVNLTAKNNIIASNASGSAEETVVFRGTGTQDFSYNDVWGNGGNNQMKGIVMGSGNIQLDPLFVDTTNWHLKLNSPCVNAGDPGPAFNDLDGTRNDMGIDGGPYGTLVDQDQDGLSDFRESQLGTDPTKPDTDNDRVLDGEEVDLYGTDPKKADTDGDGASDGTEIEVGTNPLDPTFQAAVFTLHGSTYLKAAGL